VSPEASAASPSATATAARFRLPLSAASSRAKAAQRAAIRCRVASLNGCIMPLDYNTRPFDEKVDLHDIGKAQGSSMEAAADKLASLGWSKVEATGFIALVGPLWHRVVDGLHEYALLTEDKHHNRRGVVQGGGLMTFAARTC